MLSERIWEWSLASLPLDPIIFYGRSPKDFLAPGSLEGPLTVFLCVAVLGTFRDQLLELVAALRRSRAKLTDKRIVIILVALGLLAASDVIMRVAAHPSAVPVFIALVFAIIAVVNGVRSAQAIRKHGKKFLGDRMAQVEQANVLNLAAVSIPTLAARLVSIVTATDSLTPGDMLAGTAASCVLILALRPANSNFMAPCPRCRRMTSRVLITEGCCPFCEPEKFLIKNDLEAETLVNETR